KQKTNLAKKTCYPLLIPTWQHAPNAVFSFRLQKIPAELKLLGKYYHTMMIKKISDGFGQTKINIYTRKYITYDFFEVAVWDTCDGAKKIVTAFSCTVER
ncbi:hypothetical protein ACJX0J_024351, partial [Zea mays]